VCEVVLSGVEPSPFFARGWCSRAPHPLWPSSLGKHPAASSPGERSSLATVAHPTEPTVGKPVPGCGPS